MSEVSQTIDESLRKITKGAGIILIGTIIGMLFGFINRVIIIRYITQSEYGIYSLGLVLFSIFTTISFLGLHQGTPRYIAFYRGKKDEKKIKEVAYSSIKIALTSSIILALWLFLASNFVSTNFFHNEDLATPLRIFSIAIPFFVLINVLMFIFRGFDKAKPQVYFQNILQSVLFLLCLCLVIVLNLSFLNVIYAFVTSTALTLLFL